MRDKLNKEKQDEIGMITTKIRKRVKEIDEKIIKNKKLMEYEKMESNLKRNEKYEQLSRLKIKQKIDEIKISLINQRNTLIFNVYKVEEQKL